MEFKVLRIILTVILGFTTSGCIEFGSDNDAIFLSLKEQIPEATSVTWSKCEKIQGKNEKSCSFTVQLNSMFYESMEATGHFTLLESGWVFSDSNSKVILNKTPAYEMFEKIKDSTIAVRVSIQICTKVFESIVDCDGGKQGVQNIGNANGFDYHIEDGVITVSHENEQNSSESKTATLLEKIIFTPILNSENNSVVDWKVGCSIQTNCNFQIHKNIAR